MAKSNAVSLPADVRPVEYRLTLEPDLSTFTFEGTETVNIEVLSRTSRLVLNCIEIVVQSCRVTREGGIDLAAVDIEYDVPNETVTFTFGCELEPGPAELHIGFTGELNDKLRGFYRSRYTGVDGEERYLATTQLEATDARRGFPCWDEPGLKAVFDVTLVVPSGLTAISNMPVATEEEVRPDVKAVRYEKTPVVSTYLLAFVVGDLDSIEQRDAGGTLHRVWTTRGKVEQGQYALETSVRLLKYLNDYFGIPYPLPKLDHIAIPDFTAGAMENWGAVTYRETALLVDPENSSAGTRERVASVVAHEMAHMWFGDLVTMSWWNDLWLNESFASWMGNKAVDYLYPEWDMWTQFVTDDTNRGLSLDGLKSSHPVEQEVSSAAEIGQLFDEISYSKGGAILRMLEQYLGDEPFRAGLNLYLKRHEYGNARTTDLWEALGEASGKPVSEMMHTWVNQTGHPVLDVAVGRTEGSIEATLSQKRFLYEHVVEPQAVEDTLWHVPVGVRTASDAQARTTLMTEATASVTVEPASYGSVDEWIKVNPLQTGFFRVKYPPEEMARLRGPIENRVLPAADRLGIQNDAFALMRSGHIPATEFLSTAEAYRAESDASVCEDLALNLSGLDSLLWDEAFYGEFQLFARGIFLPIAQRMGWDARAHEGHRDVLLRSTVLAQAGGYGDPDTLDEASARFQAYAADPSGTPADIRGVVFNLAARTGDASTYDTMWRLQDEAGMEEEKVRLLLALGRFGRRDLLERTLEKSLSSDVRSQNTVSMVMSVAGNRLGRDLAWEFVKDNWAEFDRRYGEGEFILSRLVSITSRFTTSERGEDVESFFRDHPTPSVERTIRQSLERIRINVAWLDRNRQGLAEWFGR